jgi:hypothetical protein
MITKRHIETDLRRLHTLYSASVAGPDPAIPIYFSKLGVLELSGWVEESFDMIAYRAVKRSITTNRFQDLVDNAIKRNYGFSYEENFVGMMARLIGLPKCERLERHLDTSGSFNILKAELGAMLGQRREAAHVDLAHTKLAFDAPSVSLGRLTRIYPILREIYSWFCSAK